MNFAQFRASIASLFRIKAWQEWFLPKQHNLIAPNLNDEFYKVHKGLRRLSLNADQSLLLLQRLDERIMQMDQTAQLHQNPAAVRVDQGVNEATILRACDAIDKAMILPEQSVTALTFLSQAKSELCAFSRWQSIAEKGGGIEDPGIEVIEARLDASLNRYCVDYIVRQGYRRDDGSLVRSALIIAIGPNIDKSDTSATVVYDDGTNPYN